MPMHNYGASGGSIHGMRINKHGNQQVSYAGVWVGRMSCTRRRLHHAWGSGVARCRSPFGLHARRGVEEGSGYFRTWRRCGVHDVCGYLRSGIRRTTACEAWRWRWLCGPKQVVNAHVLRTPSSMPDSFNLIRNVTQRSRHPHGRRVVYPINPSAPFPNYGLSELAS